MMLLEGGLKIAQRSAFSVPLKITVENYFLRYPEISMVIVDTFKLEIQYES